MAAIVLEQPSRLVPADSIESSIGNTPLIRLRNVTRDLPAGVEVLVKAEHLNPGGSVKDRPALWMIVDGERSGRYSMRPAETPASLTA